MQHTIFIEQERTADFQMTKGILHILENDGNVMVLILVVVSIPVAMPAMLSVTLALGALALSKLKTIVSWLAAIEEMASVDILCSNKTDTLTKNQYRGH